MLSVAVREGGGNPDQNNALRLAIEKAREANVPGDNIQKIITKYSEGGKDQLETIQFEGYGPAGTAFIIDVITDSRNRASQEIRHTLSSHGGSLASPGSVMWMFEKYGSLVIPLSTISFAELEGVAIEAGAHDILEEDGKAALLTRPDELSRVKKFIEDKNIRVESAQLEYRAKNTVLVSDPALKKRVEDLYETLDDSDDVQEIYDNIIFSA